VIVLDRADPVVQQPPVQWAAGELRDTLISRGVAAELRENFDAIPEASECLVVAGMESEVARPIWQPVGVPLPDAADALVLGHGKVGKRSVRVASGSNARGISYALLELADRANLAGDPMAEIKFSRTVFERSTNDIRSVNRGFCSDVEDKSWFNDRAFWSRYLTMLAAQRFNRFNLTFGLGYDFTSGITDCYFHFAYPFLLSVPGYNVRAVSLPDAERDANLETLRFISDEAARRGLHFQLGLWTHAYQWTNSPKANYTIEGLTPETHGPYCRDALRALLTACPSISGITFRIHGESGVAEGNYDLWKMIFDGVAQCGRPVEIDMHAKGMDQGMIDVALGTKQPVIISPKFWAEHMGLPYMQGAIRPTEMPPSRPGGTRATGFFSRSSGSRSFLRYGYGDLLAEDRGYGVLHRIWPGTQRVLVWGDPEIAEAYGRVAGFCGSKGVELFEPLFFKGRKGSGLPGGRDAYADAALRPKGGDFEKYLYTYRVWGRSLYNPNHDRKHPRRFLEQQFGRGAEPIETALLSAGKILPLVTTAHCPSAANNNYWPEMYFNMPIVDAGRTHPYGDTPSPKRLGTVSPLDPEFFLGLDEFADELIKGERSGKYSPAWVAEQLEAAAEQAVAALRQAKSKVRDEHSAEFRRLTVDVTMQAGLGKFFAAKFRSGVLYAIYQRTYSRAVLERAIAANRAARDAWTELAQTAQGVYRSDVTFGPEYFQRGHWLDRLPAMDADIADMQKLLPAATWDFGVAKDHAGEPAIDLAAGVIKTTAKGGEHPPLAGLHTPPRYFKRGETLEVLAHAGKVSSPTKISGMRLRYRRVNQAELWQAMDMEKSGADYRAVIAAEYTDSPFPLQYHFQVLGSGGVAWLHPGLEPGWLGQPYFIVRQRRESKPAA
jgi:hypothetical protein